MTDLDNAAPNAGNATAPTIWRYLNESIVAIYGPWVTLSDYQALAAERDAMQAQVELLRKERDVLLDALIDIEGHSRLHNPTGNPKWINDHAREALASTAPKEGE